MWIVSILIVLFYQESPEEMIERMRASLEDYKVESEKISAS